VDVALVLECARANGDIVSARKGILDLRIDGQRRGRRTRASSREGAKRDPRGRPDRGDLHALNGAGRASTVNVGVIAGGTRPNVVAERCTLDVDLRLTPRGLDAAEEPSIRRIARRDRGARHDRRRRASLTAGGRWRSSSAAAARRARPGGRRLARLRGRTTRSTGGASRRQHDRRHGHPDASTVSGRSAATTSAGEYVEVDSIVPRTTMLGRAARWRSRRSRGHRLARRRPRMTDTRPALATRLVGRAVGGGAAATAAAIVVGDACWVAGTTDAGPDGRSPIRATSPPRRGRRLAIIAAALGEAGFDARDVGPARGCS
jgi:hypothetical protein